MGASPQGAYGQGEIAPFRVAGGGPGWQVAVFLAASSIQSSVVDAVIESANVLARGVRCRGRGEVGAIGSGTSSLREMKPDPIAQVDDRAGHPYPKQKGRDRSRALGGGGGPYFLASSSFSLSSGRFLRSSACSSGLSLSKRSFIFSRSFSFCSGVRLSKRSFMASRASLSLAAASG